MTLQAYCWDRCSLLFSAKQLICMFFVVFFCLFFLRVAGSCSYVHRLSKAFRIGQREPACLLLNEMTRMAELRWRVSHLPAPLLNAAG